MLPFVCMLPFRTALKKNGDQKRFLIEEQKVNLAFRQLGVHPRELIGPAGQDLPANECAGFRRLITIIHIA